MTLEPVCRQIRASKTLKHGLPAIALLSLALSGSPALAQMSERAATALGTANTGGAMFTEERRSSTASAFTDIAPPQSGITPSTIEDDATLKLLSTSTDVQAYDRVQSRSRLVLEPSDARLDPAKWASTTGVTTMGDLQSGEPRSCQYSDFGSAPQFQRTCDRFRDFTTPYCSVMLDIATDGDLQDNSACATYDEDALCAPTALTCTSGPETRIINGVEETRLCWEWQQDYYCHADGQFSNCVPYESNEACTEIDASCLATSADGACSHESVSYECGDPAVRPPTSCSAIEVCEGTLCEGIPVTPDTNFAEAAAWLNIAHETAEDNNLIGMSCAVDAVAASGECLDTDIRFFEGERLKCTSNGILRDCCKGTGIATGLLGGCNAAEVRIQQGIYSGTVRHLGEYCSSSFFGFCLSRQRSFCEFNSKIARVFQEQGRLQTGLEWLGAKQEPCDGFTQEEMATINYDAIDLSELFSDMLGSAGIDDPISVEDRLKTRFSGYFSSETGDLMTAPPDPNFNEDNLTATPDPITGIYTYENEDAGPHTDLTYTATTTDPPVGPGTITLPTNPDLGVGDVIPPTLQEGLNAPQTSSTGQGG